MRSLPVRGLQEYLDKTHKAVDEALDKYLPNASAYPAVIHKAMRYSVFSKCKRIRPALAIAACEAVGGTMQDAMPAACALELIHTYSLIHDDLPCMDNADTRRGKASSHKKYGEAIAVLAGDALLTYAFDIIASHPNGNAKKQLEITRTLAYAAGSFGLIGGQVVDLKMINKKFGGVDSDLPTLSYIHAHKTGALFQASLKAGALAARLPAGLRRQGGGSAKEVEALFTFGGRLGFAFQLVDDVLDDDGYAKVFGRSGAMSEAIRLIEKGKKELTRFGNKAKHLKDIADFVVTRKY